MSGHPGSVFPWSRKRYPSECSKLRTARIVPANVRTMALGSAGPLVKSARTTIASPRGKRTEDDATAPLGFAPPTVPSMAKTPRAVGASMRATPNVSLASKNMLWRDHVMAKPAPTSFQVGTLYSSQEIQAALGVGNAGGIRISMATDGAVRRAVVLTSVPTARQLSENPYHDRIENDILVYTGTGRQGAQTLGGINRRLPQQLDTGFPVYGFVLVGSRRDPSIGSKRWRFLGLLEYVRHYPDSQTDTEGKPRDVWLFELRIHAQPEVVNVADDETLNAHMLMESRAAGSQSGDDREVGRSSLVVPAGAPEHDPTVIEGIRARLLAKPAEGFEHFIKDLLLATGFVDVSVTKYSQDGGVDVNAYCSASMWPVKNMLVQVQAKRWLHTVGRREVAELRGSLAPFARGAVVTTSYYSKAAVIEATSDGKTPIVLVDGYSLARIVARLGLDAIH